MADTDSNYFVIKNKKGRKRTVSSIRGALC
mgnify:CR=1 FL=1